MKKGKYITTPIYYVNDVPHIGHAYTTVAADVIARYYRMCGHDVFFLTGTDEHGQKVEKAARDRGLSPKEHADIMVENFKGLWKRLNISNDAFIRTSDEEHKKVVCELLQRLYEKGDIEKRSYSGWYCTPDERFWTEKDLIDGKCPDCRRPVEHIEEENYFFLMSKYQDWLIDYIESEENQSYILPESRKNEVLGFLKNQRLGDLCISRPKQRLSWGIPLPFDEGYVTYVWFDALVNYYSATRYLVPAQSSINWWPADFHLIGKDILTTHSVYWSTMLRAMDIEPPETIFAHGWWTVEGEKMSKSRGNVVNPFDVIREFGVDQFRYFLLREVPFGLDGDFSKDAMVRRINGDLANDLGNLLSRTVSMIERYFAGIVPSPSQTEASPDVTLKGPVEALFGKVEKFMEGLEYNKALSSIWGVIGSANRYIDESAPWVLVKDDSRRDRLSTVLYNSAEVLRIISLYIYPYMPETAREMWGQLGVEEDIASASLVERCRWGGLKPGLRLKKGKVLFPRIEVKNKEEKSPLTPPRSQAPAWERIAKQELSSKGDGGIEDTVTIEDFAKIKLRVGKVTSAENVSGSRKLLKLQVDLGDEKRQVVAGIAAHYSPDEMIGKSVLIVANLKPARLMGIESQGMILAAGHGGVLSLIAPDKDIPPGSIVK